jgi:hypothetical protein
MPSRRDLIETRRKELLGLGYSRGIVEKAMDWAAGCAEGMARYADKSGLKEDGAKFESLVVQFLPPYLEDCESWMRNLGHERGETTPPA